MRERLPSRPLLVGAAVAVVLVAVALVWWLSRGEPTAPVGPGQAPDLDEEVILTLPVDLYFPSVDGSLRPESRELDVRGGPREQVRAVLEALLAGPLESGLVPLFDMPVELAEVFLGADGTAYVDLGSPELSEPPPAGSRLEMQIVYSLVNSVTLNVPEARRVVLLWNGRQRETLCGHLDTSRPLPPNPELVLR